MPESLRKPEVIMNGPRTREELEKEKSFLAETVAFRMEREFLLNALGRNNWQVDMAARDVHMSPEEFRKMMEKHHINGR